MVAWVALILSFFAFSFAFAAFIFAAYIYFRGPKVRALDPDELFDLLLEQNDTNILFRERPFDD
jgi:hypothetical protein